MRRAARRGKKAEARADDAGFQHSSRHADLESLLSDHVLDAAAATATAGWFPSRRGNSPRRRSVGKSQTP